MKSVLGIYSKFYFDGWKIFFLFLQFQQQTTR